LKHEEKRRDGKRREETGREEKGREEKRREEMKKWGRDSKSHYIYGGGTRKTFCSPLFKVPRQCPLVPLVEVRLKEGKASGSDNVKF
jgi:hypothetical protein